MVLSLQLRMDIPEARKSGWRAMAAQEIHTQIEKAADIFKRAGAEAGYLFGSAAENKLRPDSDVDLAVSGLKPNLFFQTVSQAEDFLQRPLDVIDLDIETPFTRYLKTKGKLQRVA
jgi:predicted nucleotidyltransferase